MIRVQAAGLTDVGKKRSHNEDALLLDETLRIYAVADGMGGHQAGEVASKVVLETLVETMGGVPEAAFEEPRDSEDRSLSPEANRLLSGIHRANRAVNELSRGRESLRGMGSTLSAVYFTDSNLIAANVGDSPIWLLHAGSIELISVPHTMAAAMASTPEQRKRLEKLYGHVLTRAMGVEETVSPEIFEMPCFDGDTVIIGSDGLSHKVSEEEVLEIITREPPETACRVLVDLANERGGEDNISVIVIQIKDAQPEKHRFRSIIRWFGEKIRGITSRRRVAGEKEVLGNAQSEA